MLEQIKEQIASATHIVVIQADNPDGDSLSSTLALEQILGDMGKTVTMYCGVDIPSYLRYMAGWDRVVNELPTKFDLSIIVDTSSLDLLETLQKTSKLSWITSKPSIVLDHHATDSTIEFTKFQYINPAISTTEVIYDLFSQFDAEINAEASGFIAMGILSDSLGLTSESTTAKSIEVLSKMVQNGANLAGIDDERKKLQKKSPEIVRYKGQLLQKIEYAIDGKLAYIVITWPEIEKYSHQYNPSMLVIDEMRQVEGVDIAVAFKLYPDGRITGKIRANYGVGVSAQLAEKFGGGGHKYASGFRVTDGRSFDTVKRQLIEYAEELL